ncbi:helix-turn-helix domain-containing protein [Streptomyces scopuliridis]|uniref:helix-turn-helix domain-containing protein n=1 Tax=Streptomyces scopuliridis TaxID=452529 RepID=UPI00342BEA77
MKADLWRRWRSGESISVISRQIGKPPGSVFTVLKHHGGIAPVPHKARAGALTMGEREEISRGLCAGDSYRAIAGLLGCVVLTISREVNNGGRDVYRAIAAQERALDRARRPKQCLLARRPALRRTVLTLLVEGGVVAGADRRASASTSRCRPGDADQPRDDLSVGLHHPMESGTPRVVQAPANWTPDPEERESHGEETVAFIDQRCPTDRGAAPGGE